MGQLSPMEETELVEGKLLTCLLYPLPMHDLRMGDVV